MRKSVLCLFLVLTLQGCADMEFSNPFASSSSDANEVFYDQFNDVPIPRDMSVDRKRSLVSVTPEGIKIGLVTTEGRVDMASLTAAMIHNMARQGWGLRTTVTGAKTVQAYEKDSKFVVLYYYEQTTSVAMEIWSSVRLPDGMVMPSSTGNTPLNAPVSDTYSGGGSGMSSTSGGSQPLTQ